MRDSDWAAILIVLGLLCGAALLHGCAHVACPPGTYPARAAEATSGSAGASVDRREAAGAARSRAAWRCARICPAGTYLDSRPDRLRCLPAALPAR